MSPARGRRESGPGDAFLDARLAEARATRDRAVRAFGPLDATQLAWRPAPGRWSVAQNLRHLIASDEGYWPALEAIAAGRHRPPALARVPGWPRLGGALLRHLVAPRTRRRFRTVRRLEPSDAPPPPTLVADFAAHVDAHLARLAAAWAAAPPSTVLTSPFSALVAYSLEDAVVITVTHLERHVRQAERVLEHPAFPRRPPPTADA